MSRLLLCEECRNHFVGSHVLEEGRYQLDASPEGPAEWVRVRRGLARPPTVTQRTIVINGAPIPPTADELTAYDCDHCGTAIRPGQVAWCVTVWLHREPPEWEAAYVDLEMQREPKTPSAPCPVSEPLLKSAPSTMSEET